MQRTRQAKSITPDQLHRLLKGNSHTVKREELSRFDSKLTVKPDMLVM